MHLSETQQRKIIWLIAVIFLIQLPVSVIKLFTWGQGETPLSLNGHSNTTFVALIAIGFLFSFYFVYRQHKVYILYALGFIAFCLIGGKRAPIFLLPFILLLSSWHLRYSVKKLFKITFLGFLFGMLFFYLTLRIIPALNPQRQVWGDFDPGYALSYAQSYDTAFSKVTSQPIGRLSTTIYIYQMLTADGSIPLLIGLGPGSVMKSRFNAADNRGSISGKYGIGYGLNGINWLVMQVGYLGFVFYIYFYWLIWRAALRCFTKEKEPFWRAFGLGMVNFSFIMLVIGAYYAPVYKNDSLSIFFFCLAAITIVRSKWLAETNSKKQTSELQLINDG